MAQLGKLMKVDLRKVWEHEARDFSDWLVKDENLALLSEELGIEIEAIGTEQSSGRFKIDILAKEANSGDYIIIENQLEPTNHDHLGKVITYAAGYDAKYIIWIVKDVLDEHQKAIEWLNDHLDESISCFLIKIEVWQIGDSKPAPSFEIVTLKNNWVATLKKSVNSEELSVNQQKQQEFWTALKVDFQARDGKIKVPTPSARHYLDFKMGTTICHTYLSTNSRQRWIRCGLWTTNQEFREFLEEREEDLKLDLGISFNFFRGNKSGGVVATLQVSDIYDQSQFSVSFDWLYEHLKLFQNVFKKYVEEFKQL